MTFSFDDQFTMFDVTPVENQFILEQLPGARGDYVKVYLYGLLYCYHPKEEVNLESMARDLDMTCDEIMAAYRYWERHKAVRRISDNPPVWQYVSFKQRAFASDDDADPDYVRFSQDLERSFDGIRSFRGSEIAEAYEWKDSMDLPPEVIIMIFSHMLRTRGKNFRMADAQKLAVRLAEENARTEDEAAEVLSRDETAAQNMRKILRKLGKRYSPSDANMSLYLKWTRDWGFSQEAIEEACDRTGTSDPSLALVDSILQKTRKSQSAGQNRLIGRDTVRKSADRHEQARKVMRQLGRTGSVTAYQEEIFGRMTSLYPFEIVMAAARECSRKKKDPESLLKLLESWKARGFTTLEEVEEHIRIFHDREDFMRKIRGRWPVRETEPGERNMDLLSEWEDKLGLSRDLILKAADFAAEAKNPMAYLNTILNRYAEKGIRTPEEAERDRLETSAQYPKAGQNGKSDARDIHGYGQRDYSNEQKAALERMMNDTWGDDNA